MGGSTAHTHEGAFSHGIKIIIFELLLHFNLKKESRLLGHARYVANSVRCGNRIALLSVSTPFSANQERHADVHTAIDWT